MYNFKLAIFLTILVLNVNCGNQRRTITSYMNCNQKWHSIKTIGDQTICSNGSLVSCLAMILQSRSVIINGKAVDPQSMNYYLQKHNGYTNDNREIDFSVLEQLGIQMLLTTSDFKIIRDYFDQGYDVILNFNFGKNYGVLLGYELQNNEYHYIYNNPQDSKNRNGKESEIVVGIIFGNKKNK